MGWLDKAKKAFTGARGRLREGVQQATEVGGEVKKEVIKGKPYYDSFRKQVAPVKPKPKKARPYEKTVIKYKYRFR